VWKSQLILSATTDLPSAYHSTESPRGRKKREIIQVGEADGEEQVARGKQLGLSQHKTHRKQRDNSPPKIDLVLSSGSQLG